MEENSSRIIKIIKEKKDVYFKWVNELSINLSKNSDYDKEIYLINKNWIDKYIQQILNSPYDGNELINLYNQFEYIDNTKLFTQKDINQLPKLFILNDKCWSIFVKDENIEKPIKLKSLFWNKMITFEFIKENNYITYCIFFLDKKSQIRQGFLQINKLKQKKE